MRVDKLLEAIRRNPRNVRFSDPRMPCGRYFGKSRQRGSRVVYLTPWQDHPTVSIQPRGNLAKDYQVRQVLRAIDNLEESNG